MILREHATIDVESQAVAQLGRPAQTETLLDAPFRAVAGKYELTDQQVAASLGISAAILIQNCAGFLDPHVAYVVATYGMVEGAKTVPFDAAEVAA